MTEPASTTKAAQRLEIIQYAQSVRWDVAKTCRLFGISRPRYYRWLRRYREEGLDGLQDRSSRPRRSPRTTNDETVAHIVAMRVNERLGPHRIAERLKRDHDIDITGSGVWLVLKRLGMNRLPRLEPTSEIGESHRP